MKVKYIIYLSLYCILYFTALYTVYLFEIGTILLGVLIELFTIPTMLLTLFCSAFGIFLLLSGKTKSGETTKLLIVTFIVSAMSTFFLLDLFSHS